MCFESIAFVTVPTRLHVIVKSCKSNDKEKLSSRILKIVAFMGTEFFVPQYLTYIKWINMLPGSDSVVVIGNR